MKIFVITGCLMAISIVLQAQYDPEAKEVLDAMGKKYRSIPAFTATFSQKLSNESAGLEESIEGKITVKQDRYKLEIADQEIYNDGTNIWTYNPEISEIMVSPYEPDEQEISLNNIWNIYQDGFKYILLSRNPNGNNVVDLDPIDRSKSYFKIRMIIGSDNSLKSFTIFEHSGNKFKYEIIDFTKRPDIKDDFFTLNPDDYPDAELLDYRDN